MAGEGGAAGPRVLSRRSYLPPPVMVPEVQLRVDLAEVATVTCLLKAEYNPAFEEAGGDRGAGDLALDCEKHLKVKSVFINGSELGEDDFAVADAKLVIRGAALAREGAAPGTPFTILTVNEQRPSDNLQLSGLYKSDGFFCTQMEALGFRRFAPHLDRPDVMSKYSVVVTGDKAECPVLLCNGDLVSSGDGEVPEGTMDAALSVAPPAMDADGRHWTKWVDPWAKPTYLFAVVGGDLAELRDTFTTMSGKEVELRIFAVAKDIAKCRHAMDCLQASMAWDERAFGREYDLGQYNVVAVSSFTMGAMENKSLNVFNTKYVLADAATATDVDHENVARVIAHEYCHNYSGNRVTCRDWFQLTLKEGFTVFRDHEFSSDTGSRPMRRIHDVTVLRAAQFAEDAGPMSHPVRPDEVVAIDNFYSVTVYEKGAEVVSMYDTILGRGAFRRGTDSYFARFDGKAVTCDDFATALEDANWEGLPEPVYAAVRDKPGEGEDAWIDPVYTRTGERPLTQFRRWYAVGGTPHVTARTRYDEAARTFSVVLRQEVPASAKQPGPKPPLHIPIRAGLLGPDGKDIALKLREDPARWDCKWGGSRKELAADAPCLGAGNDDPNSVVLHLTEPEQEFVFEDVDAQPVASLLRGFSAPIILKTEGESAADRLFRMAHDSDPFNAWDAANALSVDVVLSAIGSGATDAPVAAADLHEALRSLLARVDLSSDDPDVAPSSRGVDPRVVAHILAFPPSSILEQAVLARDGQVDPTAVAAARRAARAEVAHALWDDLVAVFQRLSAQLRGRPYRTDAADVERRSLRNTALGLLCGTQSRGVPAGPAHPDGFDPVGAAMHLFSSADNMTDEEAALYCFAFLPADRPERAEGLAAFYERHKDESLVVDKWLRIQALTGTAADVVALRGHDAFDINVPNKVYAVFAAFAMGNPEGFHDPTGAGYDAVAELIAELDEKNSQVAARIAGAFTKAKTLTPDLRSLAQARMETLVSGTGSLSDNTTEVIQATLTSLKPAAEPAAGEGAE